MTLFKPNDSIQDRWKIIRFVGKGGMGQVYEAFDAYFDRTVALKFVKTAHTQYELRGFQVLLDVTHKNVVKVFNILPYSSDHIFIESEFVHGDTLSSILSSRPLSIHEANEIMRYLLDGLCEIEKVALHRDIKPGNIMLMDGKPETLKILDLGLAKVKSRKEEESFTICGTAGYTPPEVWRGEGDETCDVFMAGVTYYEMLCRKLPYGNTKFSDDQQQITVEEAIANLISSPLRPPRIIVEIIEKAIQLDKTKRFLSVSDLYEAFKRGLVKLAKHKDALENADQKLKAFYHEFERRLLEQNIEIESCTDVQNGLQFSLYRDFVECKINVYHGKAGFKIVDQGAKNESSQALMSKGSQVAHSILHLPFVEKKGSQVTSAMQENEFSRIKEIDSFVKAMKNNLDTSGFTIEKEADLDYGTRFRIGYPGSVFNLTIYYSDKKGISKVVGGKVTEDIKAVLLSLLNENTVMAEENFVVPFNKWIGSDESGKGDYFGPLVAAGFLVDKEIERGILKLGVRDSKMLSDTRIADITRVLYSDFKERIAVCELPPEKYNEIYDKLRAQGKGLNTVLAWCHARVIQDLAEKFDVEGAVADQFGDESYIESEIRRNPKMKDAREIRLIQRPKAEENVAVATASILARDRFARRIMEMSQKYRLNILKGAGPEVNQIARKLFHERGEAELRQLVKWHFRNTKEVTS
jgi:ribonuclease HIII